MPNLGERMYEASGKICTDPRDHVFANLSTLNAIDVEINYAKNPRAVFIEATRAIIGQERSSSIIGLKPTRIHEKEVENTSRLSPVLGTTFRG